MTGAAIVERLASAAPAVAPPVSERLERVRQIVGSFDGVLVAFSGGVDSSVVAAIAHELLGLRALAVTAVSPIRPTGEAEEAARVAGAIGIAHRLVETSEIRSPAFLANRPDRCYVCKRSILDDLLRLARAEGLAVVADGTNVDDGGDYRPGARAVRELGVRSPLQEAGATKADVRAIAAAFGLPNANRPSGACLATRIPYGQRLTRQRLARVDRAEAFVRGLGFGQLRVRDHGDVARLELLPDELPRALDAATRRALVRGLHDAGYRYVALDLDGFRSGSMNEVLGRSGRQA